MSLNVTNTWRVVHPYDRDVSLIHIIRYEWWDTEEKEQGRENRNFVLSLDPTPHWVQYDDMDIIAPTLEISGLDLSRMGCRKMPAPFDLRNEAERKINDMIVQALSHVADVKPPIEFSDADS